MSAATPDPAQGHRPVKEWVVIEPRDSFRSDGTIVLPDAYDDDAHGSDRDMIRERNTLCLGIVRAVGPGYRTDSPKLHPAYNDGERPPYVDHDIRVDMVVMYDRASAIKLDGTTPMLVTVRAHGVLLEVEGDVEPVLGGLVSKRGR